MTGRASVSRFLERLKAVDQFDYLPAEGFERPLHSAQPPNLGDTLVRPIRNAQGPVIWDRFRTHNEVQKEMLKLGIAVHDPPTSALAQIKAL